MKSSYSRKMAESYKNSKLCGTCPVSTSFFPASSALALKTNRLRTTVTQKTSSRAATGGSQQAQSSPKSHIPRRLSLFDLSGSPLEKSICRTYLYLTRLRACSVRKALTRGHLFKKKKRCQQLFNTTAARGRNTNWNKLEAGPNP